MRDPDALLHHAYFPHILETILDASTFETQLAFRQTCRSMRDRVDGLFARHLVLTDGLRTVRGDRPPWTAPFDTSWPPIRLLDVYVDPSPELHDALHETTMDTVRVYGLSGADYRCNTLVLSSLHQLPSTTCADTLVLNVTASGYVHFITTTTKRHLTLVIPRGLRVVFLDGSQRRRIRIIGIDEWKAERAHLVEL